MPDEKIATTLRGTLQFDRNQVFGKCGAAAFRLLCVVADEQDRTPKLYALYVSCLASRDSVRCDENLWEEGVVECDTDVSVRNQFPPFTVFPPKHNSGQHGCGVVAKVERLENQ